MIAKGRSIGMDVGGEMNSRGGKIEGGTDTKIDGG
jgi:hypothetical protein